MRAATRAGDASVAAAIQRAAEWPGIGAANLVTVLHPNLIVLGGGVAELGDLLPTPVRETIRGRLGMFPTADVRVERSPLGDKAGLMGGIALARRGGIKGTLLLEEPVGRHTRALPPSDGERVSGWSATSRSKGGRAGKGEDWWSAQPILDIPIGEIL